MKVRFSGAAKRDLDDIWLYLAVEATEAVATRTIGTIVDACLRLADFPTSGSSRDDLSPGLRVLVCHKHLAYHIVTDHETVVTRVVHGSQDARRLTGLAGSS